VPAVYKLYIAKAEYDLYFSYLVKVLKLNLNLTTELYITAYQDLYPVVSTTCAVDPHRYDRPMVRVFLPNKIFDIRTGCSRVGTTLATLPRHGGLALP
jgi:hypothetical protein